MPGAYPVPEDEPERLAELHATGILDTLPEPLYDDIVALASRLCETPIAIINFVDADRQWGKALVGLESSEAPREASFCARTIAAAGELLVVEDTLRDPEFATNAQVLGEPHLRFYAGRAIVTASGRALGSVCVADREPRTIGAEQLAGLEVLARQTAALLELRLATRRLSAANEALMRLATHDELTRLPNRRLVRELVERQLASAGRDRHQVGVVFADVNGLKDVNDTLGHAAGDRLLGHVADRLRAVARRSDTVGRIAGDEFVVVCSPLVSADDLQRVAERVRTSVAEPADPRLDTPPATVAVGVAMSRDDDDVDSLLARADGDMYAAKRLAR